MKKLAISAPKDEELYDFTTSLRCYECSPVGEVVTSDHPNVSFTSSAKLTAGCRYDQGDYDCTFVRAAVRGQGLGGGDNSLRARPYSSARASHSGRRE